MKNVNYIETWKVIMQSPSAFYREMPKNGGYFHPGLFAAGSISIMFFCILLIYPLIYPERGNTTTLTYIEMPLVVIIVVVLILIALFINASILYIAYKILGGKGSYEGTVGLVCYATAALVLAWIPLIGWIFGAYQTYLYILGGKFVHDMSMGRSALAFFMPSIMALVFVFLVACL